MAERIVVIGGGLAGLTAAYSLQRRGRKCLVFEKESAAGGLCRSKRAGGFTFDQCGHLLHFRHREIFSFVRKILGADLAMHERNAWVYAGGGCVRYPFQANLYGLPRDMAQECLLEFIKARNGKDKKDSHPACSFSVWINRTFGSGIARHFMTPYNRKFWSRPCSLLTTEWLDGFIPIPTLREVIEGSLASTERQFGYNARFWYPRSGGIQALPDRLARGIEGLRTDAPVTHVDLKNRKIRLASGEWERYDRLISTMPLPEWAGKTSLPADIRQCVKRLRWTSITCVNLGVRSRREERRHWIYFPQKDIPFYRVGFSHRLSGRNAPAGTHSLYVEISRPGTGTCDRGHSLGTIVRRLRDCGCLDAKDTVVESDICDIPYGYVVYDRQRTPSVEKIKDFLARHGVVCLGRYGSWEYLSMEGTMAQARECIAAL
ncbi:MAG: protoporphyrinogen/coproporphyrinogen oxidase [Deltaproteobacteria bacterium]